MDILPEDLRSFPPTSPTYLERNSLIVYHSKKTMGLNVLSLVSQETDKQKDRTLRNFTLYLYMIAFFCSTC